MESAVTPPVSPRQQPGQPPVVTPPAPPVLPAPQLVALPATPVPSSPLPAPVPPMPALTAPLASAPGTAPAPSPILSNEVYAEICTEILREQASIISTKLALEQVRDVPGLRVESETLRCTIDSDGTRVINSLVSKFSTFFGHAAVEVCREAASRFLVNLPPEQTPASLR